VPVVLPLAAAAGLALRPLLRSLPPRVRVAVALSGLLYVAAATGLEIVAGLVVERAPAPGVALARLVALREALEMGALLVFIRAVMAHAARLAPGGLLINLAGAGRGLFLWPVRALAVLLAPLPAIALLYALSLLLAQSNGGPLPPGLAQRFRLSVELNVGTAYNGALLLLAALLLAALAALARGQGGRFALAWGVLSAGFAYLVVDEWISIHEHLHSATELFMPATGAFTFGWVVFGLPIVLLAAAASVPLLRRLPARARRRLLLSGFVFVSGAVGFEMLSALTLELRLGGLTGHWVTAGIEELLEMAGVALFIYALLDYAALTYGQVQLIVAPGAPVGASGRFPAHALHRVLRLLHRSRVL
jgi:hypothetical protein